MFWSVDMCLKQVELRILEKLPAPGLFHQMAHFWNSVLVYVFHRSAQVHILCSQSWSKIPAYL